MKDYAPNSNGLVPSSSSKLGGTKPLDGLLVETEQARLEEGSHFAHSDLGGALSPEHGRMLQESRISREVVEARGYRTVKKKVELGELGFSSAQHKVPALLIPIYSPSGEIATYQSRPDQPRIGKNGESVKYETPRSSRMMLDVHPFAREKLGDPSIPLFVTEGIKKGDALVSRNLCAVSFLGVWNWRGTNGHGGKVALPEWDYVALNGRQVYVVFDSDVMLNPQVHAALSRLKAFLEAR